MPSPLDEEHALLLSTVLPVCEQYGLALAGGHAVKAHGLVDRPSDGLDLATAGAAPMTAIVDALAVAYRAAGMDTEIIGADGRRGHLVVRLSDDRCCRVDVFKEPLTRPAVAMDFGPVLALEDTVGLKVGALHDRGLPRDLIDVHAATRYFGNADLVGLGRRMLDEDFFLEDLRDQLDHMAVFPDEEFIAYGIEPGEISAMRRWAQQWADEIGQDLAEAEPWTDADEGPEP